MAFPQLPWTAPTRGGRPQPPAVRETSSPGRSTAPGSSQVPRPAGARSCRGGWRGLRRRAARAAGARVLGAGLPPPQHPGRKGRCATCWPLGRRLARSRPPPPPGGGLRRHRRHRGRRHLPRRHLFSSVDRCGGRPGLHMAGAACGGEAGALADEAEQARAYVAWLCRHALNPHTERPCTLPVTARTPCAHPCPHRAHRRAWVRAAWSARG